jgi:hypothetical protein
MMEAINTAFEHLCDVVSPQFDMSVKRAQTSPQARSSSARSALRRSA